MKQIVRVGVGVAICVQLACATTRDSNKGVAQKQPEVIWQQNMAIIDASVEFWRQQTGVAPYSTQELGKAIEFFETLTSIESSTMSYFGPIPDENLMAAGARWKAWYSENGARLKYDERKDRIVLSK